MKYKKFFIVLLSIGLISIAFTNSSHSSDSDTLLSEIAELHSPDAPLFQSVDNDQDIFTALAPTSDVSYLVATSNSDVELPSHSSETSLLDTDDATAIEEAGSSSIMMMDEEYHDVPFYSQFADITPVQWRKVGCGIASIAMLIDYHSSEAVDVDLLLQEGIDANAYLDDAGWTHAGLINLAKPYGLSGESLSVDHLTMERAFSELEAEVTMNPVMVSVHYTFDRNNPIPHLVVVTGIDEEFVYYNDPAESGGQNRISITQFQSAWKKRFITLHQA